MTTSSGKLLDAHSYVVHAAAEAAAGRMHRIAGICIRAVQRDELLLLLLRNPPYITTRFAANQAMGRKRKDFAKLMNGRVTLRLFWRKI